MSPSEETTQLIEALDVERLNGCDRVAILAVRCWFAEKGPNYTAAQIAAVRRIAEEN